MIGNLRRNLNRGLAGVALSAVLAGALWSGGRNAPPALASGAFVPSSAIATTQTSVQIVNMGDAPANARFRFFNSGGQINYSGPAGAGVTVPVGGSYNLDQRFDPNMPSGFDGSGIVDSDQPLAGITSVFAADGGFDMFNAIGADEVATTVGIPVFIKNAGSPAVNSEASIQNADNSAANVEIRFRGLDGNLVSGATTTFSSIPPGANVRISSENIPGLPNGFIGSAEVVSTNNMKLAVGVLQYSPGVLISFGGKAGGATELNAPTIYKVGSLGTSLVVQNNGDQTATVDLSFLESAASPRNVSFTDTIPAKSMKFYDQRFDNAGHPVGDNWIGKVNLKSKAVGSTAAQPISAIVQGLDTAGVTASVYSAVPLNKNAKDVRLAAVYRAVGTSPSFNITFQVDNPNASTANITVEYRSNDGNVSKTSGPFAISPNSSMNFDLRLGAPGPGSGIIPGTDPALGSIKITSDQPVSAVAISVPGLGQNDPAFKDTAAAYNGAPKPGT